MTLRDRLDEIPAGTELLRRVRFLADEDLDELSAEEITSAIRWLRAAAYSATAGAHRLERHVAHLAQPTEQEPNPCSPCDPKPTDPNTNTGGVPRGTARPVRRSPSTSQTTET